MKNGVSQSVQSFDGRHPSAAKLVELEDATAGRSKNQLTQQTCGRSCPEPLASVPERFDIRGESVDTEGGDILMLAPRESSMAWKEPANLSIDLRDSTAIREPCSSKHLTPRTHCRLRGRPPETYLNGIVLGACTPGGFDAVKRLDFAGRETCG